MSNQDGDYRNEGNFQLQSLVLDDVTPATRLLEKRRQMYEVQEALDAQKEEFARREEAFRRREEALRKKDLDLQSTLIHFNKTVTHNEAKRLRAENREAQEHKARQELIEKEESLIEDLETEKEHAQQYEKRLQELKRYSNFMKSVLDSQSDEFSDVGSIVQRYFTLKEANHKLLEEQQTLKEQMEERRKALNALQSTFESQSLASTNEYETLRNELDRTKQKANEELTQQDIAKEQKSFKLLETGQALQSVSHLYHRCVRSQHGPRIRHQPRELEELAEALQDAPEESEKKRKDHEKFLHQKPETKKDGSRTESSKVEKDILRALQQLEVVGSYIVDFERVVKEYKPSDHQTRTESSKSATRNRQRSQSPEALNIGSQNEEKGRPVSRHSQGTSSTTKPSHTKPGLLTEGEQDRSGVHDSRQRIQTPSRKIRINLKSKSRENDAI